ncbi:MAG TPA: GAF domain-containing sensor histidine kinase [Chloroflexota bacterium]|nr:GAF domain-containing sensor histidine kinase [Chloroflexota bacterium]HUM67470.1 GAF domain-containing sensor histidine kinase [Chloroflexota bacterium]
MSNGRTPHDVLHALHQATLSIAELDDLHKVLQRIVDAARDLVGARYAALGVPHSDGYLDAFIHSGMSPEVVSQIPHFPKGLGLLGEIIRGGQPIRIPRIEDDPRSVGFPPGHPPMDAFLGVPVMAGEEMLGNLYLTEKIGAAEFTAEDQEVVEFLAAHAAIAIQNARLYEQVSRLAIIEERTRIGMDLHDGIIQSIYAVGLTLESARLALPGAPDEADMLLRRVIEGLNDTIRDIRNYILDLRPHRFRGDLQEGLERLVREFQANAMIPVDLQAEAEDMITTPTAVARALFLTTQEALANVARHANATHVIIRLTRQNGVIDMMVQDDGRGFNRAARNYSVGHGLSNMRARAEDLGGKFSIQSTPGQGTAIHLTLPDR